MPRATAHKPYLYGETRSTVQDPQGRDFEHHHEDIWGWGDPFSESDPGDSHDGNSGDLDALRETDAISRDETAGNKDNLDKENLNIVDTVEAPISRVGVAFRRKPPQPYVEDTDSEEPVSSAPSFRASHPRQSRPKVWDTHRSEIPRERDTLTLVHQPRGPTGISDLLEELEDLRRENQLLREGAPAPAPPPPPPRPAAPAHTFQIFHHVHDGTFLDKPHWEPGEGGPILRASNPIRNIDHYLDQHPEVAFVFFKLYKSIAPADRTKIETKDGVFREPFPFEETLRLISNPMIEAVDEYVQRVTDFGEFFPYFDVRGPIEAPYLFMYYSAPFLPDILPDLDLISRNLISKLHESIMSSHGYEYESAKLQAEKGLVARHLMKYLVRPGDVLVDMLGPSTQAYVALDWPMENPPPEDDNRDDYEDYDPIKRKRTPKWKHSQAKGASTRKSLKYSWRIPVEYWRFNGNFELHKEYIIMEMNVGYDEEAVPINLLNFVPLDVAPPGLRTTLENRGKMFWKIRFKKFVTYCRPNDDDLDDVRQAWGADLELFR
jgi:hypothetical protein